MTINKVLGGTFALSAGLLIYELVLVRLFSVATFSNVAFLSISIALFGLAIGGIIVYAFKDFFAKSKFESRLKIFMAATVGAMFIFPVVFQRLDMSTFNPSIIVPGILIASIPFISGNICLSFTFKVYAKTIQKVYFADLVGAAAGASVALLAMSAFHSMNVLYIAVIVMIFSYLIFFQNKANIAVGAITLIALVGWLNINQEERYVDIVFTKLGKEENVIFQKSNSFSRITATGEVASDINSLSPKVKELPETRGIRIDGDAYTEVVSFNGDLSTVTFLKSDLSSLAYHINERPSALVIGAGGGRDVLTGLVFNAAVTGVDVNPIIINDVMRGINKDFSGDLYSHPNVDIQVAEGRSYIASSTDTYDLINLPLVDTWASTAGGSLFLVENYLYTVEAFQEYFDHLNEGGVLTIARWELDGVRLISQFLEIAENEGLNSPEDHIIIIGNGSGEGRLNNYAFKKTPFTREEIENAKQFAQSNQFNEIYTPASSTVNDHQEFIQSQNKEEFIKTYYKNIEPVYDNNPFFFFISPLLKPIDQREIITSNVDDYLILIVIVVCTMSCLCIILPAMLYRNNKNHEDNNISLERRMLVYFGAIGLGFMLVEIPIIQQFIVYLEHPSYSYSVVLIAILCFSGIGSLISGKVLRKSSLKKLILATLALLAVHIVVTLRIINVTVGLNLWLKVCITILSIAPLSLLLGMYFPFGISITEKMKINQMIPWAWAVNGAASVMATVLAVVITLTWGFVGSLIFGAVAYFVTIITLKPLR